jgi:hypothetical protein
MPILKRWQLEDFKKYSSQIQPKVNLNPMLGYIRLSTDGKLTKTDLAMFCSMSVDLVQKQGEMFDAANPDIFTNDILIDEKTLYGVVNTTSSDEITIKELSDRIQITDGTGTFGHKKEDVSLYPTIPQIPENFVAIGSSVLKALKIARVFISKDTKAQHNQAIHINEGMVFGINQFYSYFKIVDSEVPNVTLLKEHANLISDFDAIGFAQTDRFLFFRVGNSELIYAFVKSEWISPSIKAHFDILMKKIEEPEVNKFKIQKKDIVSFCDYVDQVSQNKINVCILEGDTIKLSDTNEFNSAIKRIPIEGKADRFTFNNDLIIQGLKALPQTEFNCCMINKGLIIRDQDNSFAYFMGSSIGEQPNV